MRHPLEFLPSNLRKPSFIFFLVSTVAIFGVFNVLDQPLRTSAAPNGIVSFELARTFDDSQSILNSWGARARLFAAFGLGYDYLFMLVYAMALSLGLLLAGHGKPKSFQMFVNWAGWGAFAAALFDALENYALWQILNGNLLPSLPQIASLSAIVKFALLTVGLLTAFSGWFIRSVGR